MYCRSEAGIRKGQAVTLGVSAHGARITSIRLSSPEGGSECIVLPGSGGSGRDEFRMGAVVGRYAGRIRNGRFELDGHCFRLSRNDGAHCLHGGSTGFADREWRLLHEQRHPEQVYRLDLLSPDGDQGFPGELHVELEYRWVPDRRLTIGLKATTTRPTPVSLAQHSYWNLGGPTEADIYRHRIQINASSYLPIDTERLPTGELRPVLGTPFDLTRLAELSGLLSSGHPEIVSAGGFDHCWVADGSGFRQVAYLDHPPSGRAMTVWTDQPGLQIYTGNELAQTQERESCRQFRKHGGIAFETQSLPDAPNQPDFPCSILRPGEVWRSTTVFEFSDLAKDVQQARTI
jgi:aldose 1-epimerase